MSLLSGPWTLKNSDPYSKTFHAESAQWNATVESLEDISHRTQGCPYSEEIAYKICELLGFVTIPETKIQFESTELKSILDLNKKNACGDESLRSCTLQRKIWGNPIWKEQPYSVSFQHACLLNIILGKENAQDGDILCHSGSIREKNWEAIGNRDYDQKSSLRMWSDLRTKAVDSAVVDQVLSVSKEEFLKIADNYRYKTSCFSARFEAQSILSWQKEYGLHREKCKEVLDTVLKNFKFLKKGIEHLQKIKATITIDILEKYVRDRHNDNLDDLYWSYGVLLESSQPIH